MSESLDCLVFNLRPKIFAMHLMRVRCDPSATTENFLLFRKVIECFKMSFHKQIEMVV